MCNSAYKGKIIYIWIFPHPAISGTLLGVVVSNPNDEAIELHQLNKQRMSSRGRILGFLGLRAKIKIRLSKTT